MFELASRLNWQQTVIKMPRRYKNKRLIRVIAARLLTRLRKRLGVNTISLVFKRKYPRVKFKMGLIQLLVKYAKESIQFKSIMYIKPIPHGYMRYKK
jgi:hypothetical protein